MAFPGTYNFSYYKGDTFQFVVRPKDSSGNPFDLTDYTAEFTIANVRGSSGTQYAGSATVDETNMLVTCTISPVVGNTLSPTTYVYDVEITDGSAIYTILTGTVSVTDHITGAV